MVDADQIARAVAIDVAAGAAAGIVLARGVVLAGVADVVLAGDAVVLAGVITAVVAGVVLNLDLVLFVLGVLPRLFIVAAFTFGKGSRRNQRNEHGAG